MDRPKISARYLVVLIAIQMCAALVYLDRAPRVFVDEAWDTGLAWNIANNGKIAHPFIEGFGGMKVHFIQNRLVLPLVSAVIFQFADCTIFTSRLGSVLFSIIAVCSLFVLMYRWFGNKQAFWICLAMIFNPWFWDVSRRARPEIHYTTLGILLLLLIVIYFEKHSRITAFFCGIVGGLLALTHPNGIIIVFCVGVSAIVWLRTKPVLPLFIYGFIGLFIVVLPYLIYVLYAVQNPDVNFMAQMQGGLKVGNFVYRELVRYKHFLNFPYMVPIGILMFIAFIAAFINTEKEDKVIAGIVVLYFLIIPFLNVSITPYYLAAIVPFASAMIARLVLRAVDSEKRVYSAKFVSGVLIAVIYTATSLGQIGHTMYSLRNSKLETVIGEITKTVGPAAKVHADPLFWFGKCNYDYGRYYISYEGLVLKDYLDWAYTQGFEYYIRTSWYLAPPFWGEKAPQEMPDFRKNVLSDYICKQFGTKINTISDPYYGIIEIYKIDWSKPYY